MKNSNMFFFRSSVLFIVTLTLISCSEVTAPFEGRATVVQNCRSVETTLGLSVPPMIQIFGETKIDEWCDCTYDDLRTKFTAEQIASAPSAGMFDETASAISGALYLSLASCITNDTQVPQQTLEMKNMYAEVIRARMGMRVN
jgi:hypothetical protein